jgi:hypothetical protein
MTKPIVGVRGQDKAATGGEEASIRAAPPRKRGAAHESFFERLDVGVRVPSSSARLLSRQELIDSCRYRDAAQSRGSSKSERSDPMISGVHARSCRAPVRTRFGEVIIGVRGWCIVHWERRQDGWRTKSGHSARTQKPVARLDPCRRCGRTDSRLSWEHESLALFVQQPEFAGCCSNFSVTFNL